MKTPLAVALLALTVAGGSLAAASVAQSAPQVQPRNAVGIGADQLWAMQDDTTYWQGWTLTLNDSIVFSDDSIFTKPIGDDTTAFTSVFDGNGKSISNLTVNVTTTSSRAAAGLFGVLGAGHAIRNLRVTGNIYSEASSSNSSWHATSGGIAGYAQGGTISNVSFQGTVKAVNTNINSSRAGGIVGTASSQTIEKAMVPISETVVEAVGGDPIVGGLVGQANGSTSISQSASAASVLGRDSTGSGATEVGGIVGEMYLSGVRVADSYAIGDVRATRSAEVAGYRVDIGGVAGSVFGGAGGPGTGGSLSRIYSVSPVSTSNFVPANIDAGALIGSLSDDTVAAAFFDSAILPSAVGSLQSGVVDDTGTTSAALKSLTTYAGVWPIVAAWAPPGANVWGICDGQSTPYLLWQVSIDPCITDNTISGVAAVGETLTSDATTPSGRDNLAYRWGYMDGDTFVPIRETPFRTYVVTGADAGRHMAVRVTNELATIAATQVSIPTSVVPSPTPPPTYPPSAPLGVTAVAEDKSAAVRWSPPTDPGSFPVSTYQVRSTPPSAGCLTSDLSCEVTGLVNGTSYTFEVRALNGSGWGPWSTASDRVTPAAATSILITGTREGPTVVVEGATTGLVGEQVTPWVRLPGQPSYVPGTGVRTVDEQGRFSWERQTGKKIYVYFRSGEIMSNRVIVRR